MTKYIVEIAEPSYRDTLAQYGKVGQPQSLNTIVIFETDMLESEIRKIPGIVQVEPDGMDRPFDVAVQHRPDSWFLPSASNTNADYHYDRTGERVAIYFLDSGARSDHIDFQGREIATVYTHDGFEYGNVPGADHGTMVASCAGGNIHGIAKGASLFNLRYNWTTSEGIKALDTMLMHYRSHTMPSILSMSFGSYSNIYASALNQLAGEGIVLVAAAGNFDESVPTYPALRSDVIAVAACDRDMRPAVWGGDLTPATNYGSEVDIWAGGHSGIAASTESNLGIQWAGGTSAACPLVAGMIALMLEGQPRLKSYTDVLAVKAKMIERSRKDVIIYPDEKYNGTPNRYIFTLMDAPNPDPDHRDESLPDETEDETTAHQGKTWYAVGLLAVVVLLLMVL